MNVKLAVVLALCAASGVASAAINFASKSLLCQDGKYQVSCTGKVTGLGNTGIFINLDVVDSDMSGVRVATVCRNPKGKESPGQNPAAYTAQIGGYEYINPNAFTKNGSYTFSLQSDMPDINIDWLKAGCPNSQWTAEISDFLFTGEKVLLTVFQAVIGEEGILEPASEPAASIELTVK